MQLVVFHFLALLLFRLSIHSSVYIPKGGGGSGKKGREGAMLKTKALGVLAPRSCYFAIRAI